MWKNRILVTAVIAVAALGAASYPADEARAGGQHERIIGDLNGDGLSDEVQLDSGPRGDAGRSALTGYVCEAVVSFSTPKGGHTPPTRHSFMTIPSPAECPDLGTAANLDNDPAEELVVGWFDGAPASIGADLVILDTFRVVNTVIGLQQPSYIGSADFNGDGFEDIYEWTDQGEGFRTFYGTGASDQLVPGTINWCSGRPDYQVVDFLGDGTLGVVVGYFEGCAEYFSGVAVLFPDGRIVHLQASELGDDYWTVEVLDVNDDGFPDVRTTSQVDGRVTTFINGRDGSFGVAPRAVLDTATVSGTRRTNLRVLENDLVSSAARIRIVTPPRYGTVQLTSGRSVVYTPKNRHGRTDRFVYQVTDLGRTSNAAVYLRLVG